MLMPLLPVPQSVAPWADDAAAGTGVRALGPFQLHVARFAVHFGGMLSPGAQFWTRSVALCRVLIFAVSRIQFLRR
jgi:hypothetical protein